MRRLAPLALLSLTTGACSGPLAPPLEAFHDGRLPESATAFRHLEPALANLSHRDQARYALYRGLVHLGLGDAKEADRWLSLAKRLDRADPRCFDPVERGELYSAWRTVGRMPGED